MAEINNTELLRRAKMYIDKLAQGVNPITEESAADDSCVNNVKISRCLFFVSDILNQVIENGGRVGAPPKDSELDPPVLTEQIRSEIPISAEPISISVFAKALAEVLNRNNMRRVPNTYFTNWLVSKKLLDELVGSDNRRRKVTNGYSASVGIMSEVRQYEGREYTAVLYTAAAQNFLLDNLEEIMSYNSRLKSEEYNNGL